MRHPTAFTDDDREDLREILGRKYDELLPRFEEAVRGYRSYRGDTVERLQQRDQQRARVHVAKAEKLARQARLLLQALDGADALTREAFSLGYLAPTRVPPRTIGDLIPPLKLRWATGDSARAAIADLATDAHVWAERARPQSRGRRGRKIRIGNRQRLAEWIGIRLARAGIELTFGPNGRWARTLETVYKAAEIPVAVEQDLYRDMRRAYDYLQEDFPDLAPPKPVRKSAPNKRD